jgi:hypothetical protein
VIIDYVAQPNGYGCAIACVAMIVGKTYEAMEAWLLAQGLPRSRMELGIWEGQYMEALDRHDFVYVRRYRCDAFINGQQRDEWPPKPFAPVHICCADVDGGHHAFVMLADGRVLDPARPERTAITHPDYKRVDQVLGVWRMP